MKRWLPLFGFVLLWAASVMAVAAVARVTIPDYLGNAPTLAAFPFPLVNFDAGYYMSIAQHGYVGNILPVRAFFPLFPLLVAAGHWLVVWVPAAWQYPLAATGINLALTAVVLWLAGRLLERDFGSRASGAWLLLLYPYAFVLVAGYAEALLLTLTLGAFVAARERRWWLAGVLAMLAGGTRLPGLLVAPALLVEYLHQAGWRWRQIGPEIGWLVLAPLGTLGYFAYLQWSAGGIGTYFQAYTMAWPERVVNMNILHPLERMVERAVSSGAAPLTDRVSYNDVISVLLLGLMLVLLIGFWRQLRPSYRVCAALTLVLPLTSSILYGIGRY
ncbi:MAG TPA: hypothetical protein VLF67_00450, partial [Candidatus Saccharimonas sp.]|nr:hypothetical protein [Candidatus Saccharimonas sp.]